MILGVDGGIRTFGWAIVAPATGRVEACGVLIQDVDDELSKHADREARADEQAIKLSSIVRGRGITTIAVEEMSFAPKGSAASKIGIGLSWGVVIGVSRAYGIPRRTIPPKTWQRAIVPAAPGEKRTAAIDYAKVYAELRNYVDCDRLLEGVAESHRTHALDACGVAIYAALVPEVTRAFPVERKERRA